MNLLVDILAGIGAWFLASLVLAILAAWVLRNGAVSGGPDSEDDDTEHA